MAIVATVASGLVESALRTCQARQALAVRAASRAAAPSPAFLASPPARSSLAATFNVQVLCPAWLPKYLPT